MSALSFVLEASKAPHMPDYARFKVPPRSHHRPTSVEGLWLVVDNRLYILSAMRCQKGLRSFRARTGDDIRSCIPP